MTAKYLFQNVIVIYQKVIMNINHILSMQLLFVVNKARNFML